MNTLVIKHSYSYFSSKGLYKANIIIEKNKNETIKVKKTRHGDSFFKKRTGQSTILNFTKINIGEFYLDDGSKIEENQCFKDKRGEITCTEDVFLLILQA